MKIWKGIAILVGLVAVNVLANWIVWRWDMTQDKRYSIAEPTKELLASLEEELQVEVLLDGELNAGFTRLKKATTELLDELSVYAKVKYQVGAEAMSEELAEELELVPTVIHERTHKGKTAQTTVYPYAVVEYQSKRAVVLLLKNQRGLSGEENLNRSIENLEFAFAEAIRSLMQEEVERIAFLEGHGELDEYAVYDLTQALAQYYQIDRGVLGQEVGVLDGYKAVVIADPQEPFSETDKYILDQYLMQGGRILWVMNGVKFSQAHLEADGMSPIIAQELNVEDMLYRYGVRVSHCLVQDLQCLMVPVDVSYDPNEPNWQPLPWTYAPLLLASPLSPVTKKVSQVSATMASAIELVGGEDGIEKQVLLATSSNSKLTCSPAKVSLSLGVDNEESFREKLIPVAVSLEGEFSSLYAHLLPPEEIVSNRAQLKRSKKTKQIVVASGSTIQNYWQGGQALPLGYDRYSQMQFGNRDFMLNAVLYLTDDEGWLQLREKEFALRLLNDQRAQQQRVQAQVVSIVIPLLLLAAVGAAVMVVRRKRYCR
jgi:ABC-2 type transport system permease protein